MRTPWNVPVMLASRTGDIWLITTTEEAYQRLISDWPRANGPAFLTALEICNSLENAETDRENARQAFVNAAIEAGIPFQNIPLPS